MALPTAADIRALSLQQLTELCRELGWEGYRSRQLFSWLWRRAATGFEAMTTLSRDARSRLASRFTVGRLEPVRTRQAGDGTVKFSFRLADGEVVESVFLPDPDAGRRTVCVSTQAGCPLGCRFCRTGSDGFRRDLGWHEIAGQVLEVRRLTGSAPTNVVCMGMGEPFLNLDAVLEALRAINSDDGLAIGARHLTVSTAGIPDAIRAYAGFALQTRLAVSLNAADDETRTRLMPVNRRYPLADVMAAVRAYVGARNKRVTFEYVLVSGINDRPEDAAALIRLLRGIACKVNLIPLNRFPGLDLRPPAPLHVRRFAERLYPHLPAVTIRLSRGSSVLAGCGQLGTAG